MNEISYRDLIDHLNKVTNFSMLKNSIIDFDQRYEDGSTPLITACDNNELNAVKYLIRLGADVNAESNDYETPLINAIHNRSTAIIWLLSWFANVNYICKNGDTPIGVARWTKDSEIIKFLEENGARDNGRICSYEKEFEEYKLLL